MGYVVKNCPAFQEVQYSDSAVMQPVYWCRNSKPLKKCCEIDNCWVKWVIETLMEKNNREAVDLILQSLSMEVG